MALSARLEIRQGQGLVITPQLQQAIKLLQLSNLELEAFVEAELERNPLLQRDERDAEPDAEAAAEAAGDVAADRIDDAAARAELDTAHDEASPGERVTGDAAQAERRGRGRRLGRLVARPGAAAAASTATPTAWRARSPARRPWPNTCTTSSPSPA